MIYETPRCEHGERLFGPSCGQCMTNETTGVDELVEEVARAICSANGDDPDYCDMPNGPSEWMKYKPDARAAIATLGSKTKEEGEEE